MSYMVSMLGTHERHPYFQTHVEEWYQKKSLMSISDLIFIHSSYGNGVLVYIVFVGVVKHICFLELFCLSLSSAGVEQHNCFLERFYFKISILKSFLSVGLSCHKSEILGHSIIGFVMANNLYSYNVVVHMSSYQFTLYNTIMWAVPISNLR